MIHPRWTEEELEIIRQAMDEGKTAQHIKHLLPDRPDHKIRNGFSKIRRERRKARGLCSKCGHNDSQEGYLTCASCRRRLRERRNKRKAEGICLWCGGDAREGGGTSLILCAACVEKRRKYHRENPPRRKQSQKKESPRPFPWIASPVCSMFGRAVRPDEYVVSPFGGSASAILCYGSKVNRGIYNDIHPGPAAFFKVCKTAEGVESLREKCKGTFEEIPDAELFRTYDRIRSSPALFGDMTIATYFTLVLHRVKAGNLVERKLKTRRGRFTLGRRHRRWKRIPERFSGVEVRNLDFSEVVDQEDGPNTVFLVDPPWEGSSDPYEYDINGRHDELADRLKEAEGKVIGLCACTRTNLVRVQDYPHIYLYRTPAGATLVYSDIELNERLNKPSFRPIDPDEYGVLS